MIEPPIPPDETQRLAALHSLHILDTPPEERFDRVTRLAQRVFGVPIAVVSLVDVNRQWFKSCQGLDATETPRSISFCGHAILGEGPLVIADATLDPRFADNPLVTSAPHIRFYAGHPLKATDGSRLGTLCIIDSSPHLLDQPLLDALKDLAAIAEEELNLVDLNRSANTISSSESRLRAILDNVIDGILTIDGKGTVETMNAAAEKIFGYSSAEVVGRNVKMLMPDPYRAEHDTYLSRYLGTGEARIIGKGREVTGLCKDGRTFPMELAVSEMLIEGQRKFTGIVRDITARKRMEGLKNEFVSMVSHELRTPLTSIRGSLGLVAGGVTGELNAQTRSLVDIAYKNSERLVRLINDILDIEKIESGKMRFDLHPVELMPLIRQSIESNHGYAQQYGVKFEITQDLPEAMVHVDSDRMMQVLSNLLSNAAKFSPADTPVEISITRHNRSIRVSVSDHGKGIPETFKGKIFQKFSQADSSDTRQKGGTGLGLSITKAIVETMGGHIGFESQEGNGTTFYFELPEWQKFCTLPSSGTPQNPHAAKARILICEDDRDVAKLLGLMLEQGGFATDTAYDAAEARNFLAQGNYAAMTLDLSLPGQDGVSLIRQLRAEETTRDLPIIVVSAKAEQGRTELSGSGLKVIDWLAKPIDHEMLLADISRAIHSLGKFRPKVLHVEDDADICQIVGAVASDVAEFEHAATLAEARDKLAQGHFQLIILDIGLPDGTGWDLLQDINQLDPKPPVLVFSAHDINAEEAHKVSAALVKSSASNQELAATIAALIRQPNDQIAP